MQGDADRARWQFEQAARLAPDDPDTQSNLAGALIQDGGSLDEARRRLLHALRLDPTHPQARANLRVLERLRSTQRAGEALPQR